MTLLSFSGCEDKEGGERSRVRCGWRVDFAGNVKSEAVSTVTDGDIVHVLGRQDRRDVCIMGMRWAVESSHGIKAKVQEQHLRESLRTRPTTADDATSANLGSCISKLSLGMSPVNDLRPRNCQIAQILHVVRPHSSKTTDRRKRFQCDPPSTEASHLSQATVHLAWYHVCLIRSQQQQ